MAPTLPCTFFQQNRCRRGAECTYLHVLLPGSPQFPPHGSHNRQYSTNTSTGVPKADLKSTPALIQCRFFNAGYCKRGDTCHFSHAIPLTPDVAASASSSSSVYESPSKKDGTPSRTDYSDGAVDEVRVMGATLSVAFGEGLDITSVGSATATSIITIHSLPRDTNVIAIRNMLLPFDPELATDSIRLIPLENSTYATIKFQDAITAEKAASALDATDFQRHKLSVKLYQPKGPSNLSQSATRVTCSWFPASTVASLSFLTLEDAVEAWETIRGKVLRGRRVDCKYPSTSREDPAISVGNLPPNVKRYELSRLVGLECKHLYIHPPNYDLTPEETLIHVVSMIQQGLSDIESYEIVTHPDAPKIKAMIRFTSEDSAIRAVQRYNGQKQRFLAGGPLHLQVLYTANFKIVPDVFHAVEKELSVVRERFDGKVRIAIFGIGNPRGGSRHLVTVRLTAQSRGDLAEVKADVGKTVRGQLCLSHAGPCPLWHPHFTTKTGIQKVNEIAERTNTYIYCDKRKCHIYLFGTSTNCNRAMTLLQDTVAALGETKFYELPLVGGKWREFIREKLKPLRELFGHDKINVNTMKCSIEFHGSAKEWDIFRAALDDSGAKGKEIRRFSGSPRTEIPCECPICFDIAIEPTRFSSAVECQHVYCTTCLREYISSTAETHKFPITCVGMKTNNGSEALCDSRLDFAIAKGILGPLEFDNILNTSFTSYIRRHPKEFYFCPTTNCNTVYCPPAVPNSGHVLTCVNCLLDICMSCNVESHDGITCAEYKKSTHHDENVEKEFAEWKRQNGVQACPRCKADIEKISGCNHITCGNCKVHICWKCLEVFDQSGEVYAHMNQRHGGIGLPDDPNDWGYW